MKQNRFKFITKSAFPVGLRTDIAKRRRTTAFRRVDSLSRHCTLQKVHPASLLGSTAAVGSSAVLPTSP